LHQPLTVIPLQQVKGIFSGNQEDKVIQQERKMWLIPFFLETEEDHNNKTVVELMNLEEILNNNSTGIWPIEMGVAEVH